MKCKYKSLKHRYQDLLTQKESYKIFLIIIVKINIYIYFLLKCSTTKTEALTSIHLLNFYSKEIYSAVIMDENLNYTMEKDHLILYQYGTSVIFSR